MSEICKWLHECLDELPLINYPFKLENSQKMEYTSFMKMVKYGGMVVLVLELRELGLINKEISEAELRIIIFLMNRK